MVSYVFAGTSGGPDSVEFSCAAPGVDRFHMKAEIPASDFVEYYLAPFAMAFEVGATKDLIFQCINLKGV